MNKLILEFDRRGDCVAMINEVLRGLRVSHIEISDEDSYLATVTHYKDNRPVSQSYRYGYDRLELEFRQNEHEVLREYQMDVDTFLKGKISDDQKYMERWHKAHPDRSIHIMQHISYDEADAYVVLHCVKFARYRVPDAAAKAAPLRSLPHRTPHPLELDF